MYRIEAPAKINASLAVKGKREDGFHELDTVMVPVGLTDELTFEEAKQFDFSCNIEGLPLDESNLVVKAVRLFERNVGVKVNQHIHLEKRIPHGAGLGGGSSDAASTLLALNDMYDAGIANAVLADWAAELGSDVPFFLYRTICRCTGRGEIISPMNESWGFPVLLIKPPFGVSTPEAYKAWKSSQEWEGVFYDTQNYEGKIFYNDLEKPVFEKHIFLSVLKMWLLRQEETRIALMSGSGSTLFVLCHSAKDCEKIAVRLNFLDKTLWTHVCVTH